VELRVYWAILKRRFWIIGPIVLVTMLYVVYQYYFLYKAPGALNAYQSTTTLRIGLKATPQSSDQDYANYLTVSSTFADIIVTTLVMNSPQFATEVSRQIQSDMDKIRLRYKGQPDLGEWQNAGTIGSAISTSRTHNLIMVNVVWSTPAGAWAIANAIGAVSTTYMGTYLDYEIRSASANTQHGNDHPLVSAEVVSHASAPVVVAGPAAHRLALLLVLLLVACIIAIALAFLVEYLDDRIRSREEAEQLLQIPCFGEIPRAPAVHKEKSDHPSALY
jgi:capsular polysaccharide biosynthesis protein